MVGDVKSTIVCTTSIVRTTIVPGPMILNMIAVERDMRAAIASEDIETNRLYLLKFLRGPSVSFY